MSSCTVCTHCAGLAVFSDNVLSLPHRDVARVVLPAPAVAWLGDLGVPAGSCWTATGVLVCGPNAAGVAGTGVPGAGVPGAVVPVPGACAPGA